MRRDFRVLLVLALVLLIGGTVMAASGDIWALRNSAGSEVLRVLSTGVLVPGSDNTYDLGSSALSWKDAHIQGAATLGSASVTGAATVGTTLGVTGASTFTGSTTHNGDVTLGNAATDAVTMEGRVYANDRLSVAGDTTLAGALAVTGASMFSGGIYGTITDTPESYTVVAGVDHIVAVSDTSVARAIYMPDATAAGAGCLVVVKDVSGGATEIPIAVEPAGSDSIDGASLAKAIDADYGVLRLFSDGANWFTF